MKKILSVFVLLFLVGAVGTTVYLAKQKQDIQNHAAPATSLSLQVINPATVTVDQQFTVNVNIDTASNTVTGVELHINYDATKLQGVSFTKGVAWPQELVPGTNANGVATMTVSSSATAPMQGSSIVGVLTFKALAAGDTQISFDNSSQAAGQGESGNVVQSRIPVTVTINAVAGTTVTPSPTQPNPTPSGTVTPSATATPSPTHTITPSPTNAPGTTTTPTPTTTSSGNSTTTTSTSVTVSSIQNGQTISSNTPNISGKAPANSKVVITLYSTPQTITVYADANGNYSTQPRQPLETGAHKLVVLATDNSGNSASTTVNFTVGLPVTGSPLPTFFVLALGFILLSFGLIRLAI